MKTTKLVLWPLAVGLVGSLPIHQANGAGPVGLPADFPELMVTYSAAAAPGVFMGNLEADRDTTYYVILDRTGYPLFYSTTEELDNHVMPNGLIAIADKAIKGFNFKDETFAQVDSFVLQGAEFDLDAHDLQLLPNGHCLLMAKEYRHLDLSRVVAGGQPDAVVTGNVIQELNARKEVVFEWHTFDHLPITDTFWGITRKSVDYAHINSIMLDPLDNHLIASFRQTMDVVKINRSTGEILWRLGGRGNDFTFIGEHEENAPLYFVGQHSAVRLSNGNLLLFDNGRNGRGDATPNDRTYSRAVEYHLDETQRTATLVWEYRHTPDISSRSSGEVKRLANGHTFIEWGGAIRETGYICTEVSPAGEVVNEIQFAQPGSSASMTKLLWHSPDLVRAQTFSPVVAGQNYTSTNTGVSVTVNHLTGNPDHNGLVIKKHLEAARFARFAGKAPQLLVPRVTLAAFGLTAADLELVFEPQDLDFPQPAQLTVYHRPQVGQGEFTPVATTYDATQATLRVTNVGLGEFVFGHPDAPELPIPPRLYAPADGGTINQTQPVELRWVPNGLFQSCHLQVARDAAFNLLVVDAPGWKEFSYTLPAVDPGTNYYWRVNTSNDGGTSAWTTRSFTTVPPLIRVAEPNGSEVWQRGLDYFIRWEDNLAEDVVIELHRNGSLVLTIGTVPSIGIYKWEADLALEPGSDYSIKLKSSLDGALADMSDASFSIVDAPVLETSSLTPLPNGTMQLELGAPGADQMTVLSSTNLVNWQELGTVALTNGSGIFRDDSAPNVPWRFYRLRLP